MAKAASTLDIPLNDFAQLRGLLKELAKEYPSEALGRAVALTVEARRLLERSAQASAPVDDDDYWNRIATHMQELQAALRRIVNSRRLAEMLKQRAKGFTGERTVEQVLYAFADSLGSSFPYRTTISLDREELLPVPASAPGPVFKIHTGRIDRYGRNSLNLERDDVDRITALLPILRRQVDIALDLFGRNQAHPHLVDSLRRYSEMLGYSSAEIDIAGLVAYGVILASAENAAQRRIADRLEPELEDSELTALSSILNLHGPFILATEAGRSFLDDVGAYRRSPEEAAALRDAAKELSAEISAEGLATAAAQDLLSETTSQMGEGPVAARSTVLGLNTMRNATVALVAGAAIVSTGGYLAAGAAAWIGAVLLGEGVKRSSTGQAIANAVRDAIDDPSQSTNLRKMAPFVLKHEERLRKLAGDQREFQWIHKWIDWLKQNSGNH